MLSGLISLLQFPGIPWNLDVSLLELVYLAPPGFFYKSQIKNMMLSKSKRYDIAAIAVIMAIAILCYFNFRSGELVYYFDMKSVHNQKLISMIIIPCAFGFVLIRYILFIFETKVLKWLANFFAFLGKITIPIMFMYVPINGYQTQIGYGPVVYVVLGICLPVAAVAIFGKCQVMQKLFGMTSLERTHSNSD